MSKVDDLYEAAQKATPGPRATDYAAGMVWLGPAVEAHEERALIDVWSDNPADLRLTTLADRETVMVLIECYRAAKCYEEHDHSTHIESRECAPDLGVAIEKVESL